MTKDEIMQALRLTAMGRAGHPLQEQLAEELAKVFAHRCTPESLDAQDAADMDARLEEIRKMREAGVLPPAPPEYAPQPMEAETAPRPKRAKKAE